jgi:hypothetical protein
MFEALRSTGVVRNRSEFCQDWLGQGESYMRTLHFKKAEPSIGVMAICASRVQEAGELMLTSDRHRHIGERLLLLSEKCREIVNEGGVELELR